MTGNAREPQPHDTPEDGSPPRDPRLEIPAVLRDPPPPPPAKPAGAIGSNIGEIGIALAIGVDFLVVVAAGAGLGWLADTQLGWSPWGIMTGIGLGFIGGLFRLIHRLGKDDRAAKK